MEVDPTGWALGSISTLYANLSAETPRSELGFFSTLSYQNYTGPGATSELDNFLPKFELSYNENTRNTDFDIGATYQIQSLTAADIDETGFVQETGVNRHSFRLRGGVTHRINDSNSVNLNSVASRIDFSPSSEDVVPYNDLNNSLTFSRNLTPTMDGSLKFGVEFYDAEDEVDTFNTIYSAKADITSDLTRRLTLRLGGGVNAVASKEDRIDSRDKNLGVGPIVTAGIDYRLKRTTLSLDISENFSPTDFGEVDEIRQLRFKAEHHINDAVTFNLLAVLSNQIPASGQPAENPAENEEEPTSAFSLAPSLNYEFARDWQLQLGYRFITEKVDEGTATSNDFFLMISRDWVPMP